MEMKMTQTVSTPTPKKSRGGIGSMLRNAWNFSTAMPFGKWLFSAIIGVKAPYTGTIGAQVLELSPRYAKVTMKDRWIVRNFVPSIHAVAMTNLGEMTSGMALLCGLPAGMRGIVSELRTQYFKIAHGTLVAVSYAPRVEVSDEKRTYEVTAMIYQVCAADLPEAVVIPGAPGTPEGNVTGLLVAKFTAEWHISPVSK